MASGNALPNFITFDSGKLTFSVDAGGVSNVCSYDIKVTGKVGEIEDSFTWKLELIENPLISGAFKTASIMLTAMQFRVKAGTALEVSSNAFKDLGISTYSYIGDSSARGFAQFSGQSLYLNPQDH